MLLEEGAEGGGIREAKLAGYLLNRHVRILHQINAATDYRLENQLLNERNEEKQLLLILAHIQNLRN